MKDAYYFSHDSNARHDPKIAAMIKIHGYQGYGLWWAIVEIMHEQDGGRLEKFPMLYEGLACELNLDSEYLQRFVKSLISDYALLKEDDKFIYSGRIVRNMEERMHKRMKKVEAGRLGGIKSGKIRLKLKQNEALLQSNEPKESKVKESKVKESKVNNKITFATLVEMTEEQRQKLVEKYGESCTAKLIETLSNAKEAKGYKYKSDYHAILNWVVDRVGADKISESKEAEDKRKKAAEEYEKAKQAIVIKAQEEAKKYLK